MFLFQDVLVITRSVSVNDQQVSYQLCRQPIPIRQLELEDVLDGEMRVGGSIRGAFSNNERSKYLSRPHDTTVLLIFFAVHRIKFILFVGQFLQKLQV